MDIFDDIFTDSHSNNVIAGIVTGTVKEIYDEKFPGMIKVEIFMTDGTVNVTDWIRVIVPYGGLNRGMYFLPELGDEVAVAFERGDIERPYVIGCLWNTVDTIPEGAVTEKNNIKKIKTKGGHELIFDDTEKKAKFQIITPNKMTISMEDENSCIFIKADEDDNIIKINSKNGEITIKAQKKIILEANGTKVSVDGDGKKIDISADNINLEGKNIKISGQSVNIEAKSSLELKASSNMNITSNGVANIKGNLVKIN